jgi:hypothetical protein
MAKRQRFGWKWLHKRNKDNRARPSTKSILRIIEKRERRHGKMRASLLEV